MTKENKERIKFADDKTKEYRKKIDAVNNKAKDEEEKVDKFETQKRVLERKIKKIEDKKKKTDKDLEDLATMKTELKDLAPKIAEASEKAGTLRAEYDNLYKEAALYERHDSKLVCINDKLLLDLLIKEEKTEEDKAANEEALHAVFSKGIAIDNMRLEKLDPLIDGLCNELMSMNITAEMSDPQYYFANMEYINRFLKLAALFENFSSGLANQKTHNEQMDPFFRYYWHKYSEKSRNLIAGRVEEAHRLYKALDKAVNAKVPDAFSPKQLGLDQLSKGFASRTVLEAQKEDAEAKAKDKKKSAAKNPVSDTKEAYKKSVDEYNKDSMFFVKDKEVKDNLEFNNYLLNETSKIKLPFFDMEYQVMGRLEQNLMKDDAHLNDARHIKIVTNDIETIINRINESQVSVKDFGDIDRLLKPEQYIYMHKYFMMVDKFVNDGYVDKYNELRAVKNSGCKLSNKAYNKFLDRLKELRYCSQLFKDLNAIVKSDYFKYKEFIEMTRNMTRSEAIEKATEDADTLDMEIISYHNLVKKFNLNNLTPEHVKKQVI
jgi:hypothetical protein